MREEEKKKKEEDRLKKEEEKRKRDEAREAERREKEAEKEKKDEEKRIEEEKKKQKEEIEVKMLLNYFFSCVIMIKYFTGMRIERNWLANRLQKGIFYLLYLFKSFISIFFLFLEKEERKSC